MGVGGNWCKKVVVTVHIQAPNGVNIRKSVALLTSEISEYSPPGLWCSYLRCERQTGWDEYFFENKELKTQKVD